MKIALPTPVPSNVVYDEAYAEKIAYDPDNQCFNARIYGVCRGHVMPLCILVNGAVQRIEDIVVTDVEIDAWLAANPSEQSIPRTSAAVQVALGRLYTLIAQ